MDTNVLVDVALMRENGRGAPLWASSALVLDDVAKGRHQGYVSALSLYVIGLLLNPSGTRAGDLIARQKVTGFRRLLSIVDLGDALLHEALDEGRLPFEDAIQFRSATRAQAEMLVTRNLKHFVSIRKELQIVTPEDFLSQTRYASAR